MDKDIIQPANDCGISIAGMQIIADSVEEALQKKFNMGSDSPRFFYDADVDVLQYSTPNYQWYYKYSRTRHLRQYIQDIITLILGVEYYEGAVAPYDKMLLDMFGIKEGWYKKEDNQNDER